MELTGYYNIGGHTILPGAGFVEMAIAVAVEGHETDAVAPKLPSAPEGVSLVQVSFLQSLDLAKVDGQGSLEATEVACESTTGGDDDDDDCDDQNDETSVSLLPLLEPNPNRPDRCHPCP